MTLVVITYNLVRYSGWAVVGVEKHTFLATVATMFSMSGISNELETTLWMEHAAKLLSVCGGLTADTMRTFSDFE